MEAARVAADVRLHVEFADPAINRIFVARCDMLQELRERRRQAPEQRAAQPEPSPGRADHTPERTQTPNGVPEHGVPRADPEHGNEPER